MISDLLRYLSAKVDGAGPAGFDVVVCVGIKSDGPTAWWSAHCHKSLPTQVIQSRDEADVTVGLDSESAQWVLGIRDAPGDIHIITGNTEFWRRFVQRYLGSETTLLNLRAGKPE